jgi:glycosyltransferase involved in cell wall biosynthesis
MAQKTRVVLWGPLPSSGQVFGGGIGGYARCNGQMLRSTLASQFEMIPLGMTVPRFANKWLALLDLLPRLLKDMVMVCFCLWQERPDVIHLTALYWRSIYREAWAVFIAKRLGVLSLYDIRAGTFEIFHERAHWFERPFLNYIMRNASFISVEGQRYIPFIKENYKRKATWIPNFFLFKDVENKSIAPLNQPEAGPVKLAFVGYLLPEKGVDKLLEIGKRLSQYHPTEVTLIGAPSPAIESVLADYQKQQTDQFQITLTGRLELPQVLALLHEQHLFVFLSRFFGEGHTNAVTEALACGLPVIVSDHGFLADVVTPDAGIVIDDPHDVAKATDVILELINDWPRLQRLGAGARTRVKTAFSDEVVLPKFARIYEAAHRKERWE